MVRPPRPSSARGTETDAILRSLELCAQEHAGSWFPQLEAAKVRVRLVNRQTRPRCFLYRVRLGDGRTAADVVVKVRHAIPELRKVDSSEGRRPVLTPERSLPVADSARREFDGLRVLASVFGTGPPEQFGVLRALAWLPEHGAIVMDHVDEPTLHRALRRRPAADPPSSGSLPWSNAGAWLRRFHDAQPGLGLPASSASVEVVHDLDRAYAGALGPAAGDAALLAALGDATRRVAATALADPPPLATGHGDFTVRNVFASASGRVTVFDPLLLWRVPVYEDLARFTVGLRLAGSPPGAVRTSSRARYVDHCENAFLAGYFGAEPVPRETVLTFATLLLLDRWAGTVGKRDRRAGLHAGVRAARVGLARRSYRAEARRLLSLLS